jgi:protoporphyrinogen oxidase
VFFDTELTTSSRMFDLVFRSFFLGDVAVPARGMQRMPEQLAAHLPQGTVRLSTPVHSVDVDTRTVTLQDGEALAADNVVVATDGPTARDLLGHERIEVAPGRGTTTLYYAADRTPVEGPYLVLDADRTGPVNSVAVMSEISPFYGRPGSALVSVSVVGVPDEGDVALDAAVRSQLRGWYGTLVDSWELVRTYRIPWAQPRQDPQDLPTLAREVAVADGVWVCGDHRDTASIQGALVSGRRTAQAVLATAGVPA